MRCASLLLLLNLKKTLPDFFSNTETTRQSTNSQTISEFCYHFCLSLDVLANEMGNKIQQQQFVFMYNTVPHFIYIIRKLWYTTSLWSEDLCLNFKKIVDMLKLHICYTYLYMTHHNMYKLSFLVLYLNWICSWCVYLKSQSHSTDLKNNKTFII